MRSNGSGKPLSTKSNFSANIFPNSCAKTRFQPSRTQLFHVLTLLL